MLGEAYELERLTGDGWERAVGLRAFRLWGRRLKSGERYELTVRVPELAQPGRHRLRKRLNADRDPHPGYEWVVHRSPSRRPQHLSNRVTGHRTRLLCDLACRAPFRR
jgi:hypothetical protein